MIPKTELGHILRTVLLRAQGDEGIGNSFVSFKRSVPPSWKNEVPNGGFVAIYCVDPQPQISLGWPELIFKVGSPLVWSEEGKSFAAVHMVADRLFSHRDHLTSAQSSQETGVDFGAAVRWGNLLLAFSGDGSREAHEAFILGLLLSFESDPELEVQPAFTETDLHFLIMSTKNKFFSA